MKKGQMRLSFGMIFSIILIVVFLSFAFYSIKLFLGFQNSAKVGIFKDNLDADINKMWKSSQGSQEVEYSLSSKINLVCFIDYASEEFGKDKDLYKKLKQVYYGDENLFFYPVGSGEGLDSFLIKHLDLEKMTYDENPFCFESVGGKVAFTLKKSFNESLVTITR